MDRTINVLAKRATPTVVFGILYRNKQHRYTFVTESEVEAAKRFHEQKDAPIGMLALKFLQDYIYRYPDNWYLWKKYHTMQTVPEAKPPTMEPSFVPALEPSFGKTH